MNCTKQTSLTDKERLTAFCDQTVGQCYLDGLGKKFQEIAAVKKPTADEITKGIDTMKTTLVRSLKNSSNFYSILELISDS